MDRISSKPVKGRTAISAGLDNGIKVLTGQNPAICRENHHADDRRHP